MRNWVCKVLWSRSRPFVLRDWTLLPLWVQSHASALCHFPGWPRLEEALLWAPSTLGRAVSRWRCKFCSEAARRIHLGWLLRRNCVFKGSRSCFCCLASWKTRHYFGARALISCSSKICLDRVYLLLCFLVSVPTTLTKIGQKDSFQTLSYHYLV